MLNFATGVEEYAAFVQAGKSQRRLLGGRMKPVFSTATGIATYFLAAILVANQEKAPVVLGRRLVDTLKWTPSTTQHPRSIPPAIQTLLQSISTLEKDFAVEYSLGLGRPILHRLATTEAFS
jgi:hypothetical protein